MPWILKLGAAAAAASTFFFNFDAIARSGDLDAAATILVMVLALGYILGAQTGRLAYWVMAIYLVLKVAC